MQRFRPTALRRTLMPLLAALMVAAGTASSWAAPRYITSGRLSELDATILATDVDGPISALEALFYLDMAQHPAREVPVEYWLPGTTRTPEIERRIREGIEEFLAARSLARQEPAQELPRFLERRMLYSAAEAAWIELAVVPEIVIEDDDINLYYIAHGDQYTKRRQAQVRYIFFEVPVGEDGSKLGSSRFQSDMEALRDRILAGEITFDAAARLYSQAPSKEQGGLIPPFGDGDYFQQFERNAFDLRKIGDMSPAFLGPGGVYMLQLVSEQSKPEHRPVAEVADEIRAVLRHNHVRPYYTNAFMQLASRKRIENFSSLWEYIDDRSPVALVGRTDLTRDQLLQINPAIVNARYDVQGGLLVSETAAWIEGEIVMQELERMGQAEHRMISKARKLAHIHYAAQKNLRRRVDMSKVDTPRHALDTLRALSPVASGVPEAHVVRITLKPADTDPSAIGQRALILDAIRRMSETVGAGYLPTRPEPTEYAQALRTAAEESDESVTDLVKTFKAQLTQAPWPDMSIEVSDLGWVESLPGLSAHPAVPTLAPGEVSAPQPLGDRTDFYYVAAVRSADSTPWIDYPLVLQVAACEVEARRLLREEIARVQQEQGTIALP